MNKHIPFRWLRWLGWITPDLFEADHAKRPWWRVLVAAGLTAILLVLSVILMMAFDDAYKGDLPAPWIVFIRGIGYCLDQAGTVVAELWEAEWTFLSIVSILLSSLFYLIPVVLTLIPWEMSRAGRGRQFAHAMRALVYGPRACFIVTAALCQAYYLIADLFGDLLFNNLWMLMIGMLVWAVVMARIFRLAGVKVPCEPAHVNTTFCQGCGYDLRATDPVGRCSECGKPVVESLGPGVRTEQPRFCWQGGWGEWMKMTWQLWRRPRTVLTRMPVFSEELPARRYAVRTAWIAAWVSAIIWIKFFSAQNEIDELNEFLLVGIIAWTITYFVYRMAPGICGWVAWLTDRLHFRPAAMHQAGQCGAWVSAVLLLFGLIQAAAGLGLFFLEESLHVSRWGPSWEIFMMGMALVWYLMLPGWILIAGLIARYWLSSLRFANR